MKSTNTHTKITEYSLAEVKHPFQIYETLAVQELRITVAQH
ncbi:hypothetical protein ACWATR_16300 [Nostoc sp. UIC 10890]